MNKSEFIKKYGLIEISEKDGVLIDMIYATPNNFTNKILYNNNICLLREGTVRKLLKANHNLNKLGFKMKIWDAFRPIIYQRKMWEIYPNEKFVTNPEKGNSNHCKGCAVDVTLCTLDNKEIKMPTKFDYFGPESNRNYYKNLDKETQKNVVLLENNMRENGFSPFPSEWWHFDDIDKYDIINDIFE